MEYQFVRELNEDCLLFKTQDGGEFIFDRVEFEVTPRESIRLEIQKELKKIIEPGKLVQCEGLIKYYGLEKFQGGLYLVRDACARTRVGDALVTFEPASLREACQILLRVLQIVKSFHQTGLMAGGVSLGVLKRNNADEVFVQDPAVMNYLGKFLGPRYRIDSPVEVICGKAWTEKSDVFSWGVLAYRIITGKDPFDAATPEERMNKIMRSGVASPKDLVPKIGENLGNLILSSLNQQPNNRPSLDELESGLSAMITAGSYEVSEDEAKKHEEKAKQSLVRYESKERFWLWFRKYGFLTAGIAAIIFVLSLMFFLSKAKPVITTQTKPVEVLNYYFHGLETLDVGLLEEATLTSKNTFKDIVTNLYVINRARQAATQTFTDIVTVKVSDLKVKDLSGGNNILKYRVEYSLKIDMPEETIYIQRQDIFNLKLNRHIWRIMNIQVLNEKRQTLKKSSISLPENSIPSPGASNVK